MTGKKIKAKKMSIFVSTLRHNSDKKTVTENKIQNNVQQYKIGKFSCDNKIRFLDMQRFASFSYYFT